GVIDDEVICYIGCYQRIHLSRAGCFWRPRTGRENIRSLYRSMGISRSIPEVPCDVPDCDWHFNRNDRPVDECPWLADVCWNHIFQRITVCTGCLGNLNTRCNHTDWRRPVFSGMGNGDYRYSESISLFGTTSGAGRRPAWFFEFAEIVPSR